MTTGRGSLTSTRPPRCAPIDAEVTDRQYDIVIEGSNSDHSPAAWADAGATWWIESMWDAISEHSPVTAAYDRLVQGPPRPEE